MTLTETQAFDIGAITIILATAYSLAGQLLSLWYRVRSFFMVEVTCTAALSKIVVAYLHSTSPSKSKSRMYGVLSAFVSETRALAWVPFRALAAGKHTLRFRGVRLFYKYDASDASTSESKRKIENGGETPYLHRYEFLRWTIDWEALIKEATDWHTENATYNPRHTVYLVRGDGNDHSITNIGGKSKAAPFAPQSTQEPIGWTPDDFTIDHVEGGLERMALTVELEAATEEIRTWYRSQNWFREHGLPWKRSFGLSGAPGRGKTCFARSIAYDLDIPIYMIDLSSFKDASLQAAWNDVVTNAPCLLLLEDVDAAFAGRDAKKSRATFDQLLNAIDGVQQNSGGVLIMMSTNHIDHIDPALRRPGRMDRIIQFGELDDAGRFKIAFRILDDAAVARQVVARHPGTSPAELQEACFRVALARMFGGETKNEEADPENAKGWGASAGDAQYGIDGEILPDDGELITTSRMTLSDLGFFDDDEDEDEEGEDEEGLS